MICSTHMHMVVSVCVCTYLCSFDVRVCLTVKPTGVNGTAFEGDNVGEFVDGEVCDWPVY